MNTADTKQLKRPSAASHLSSYTHLKTPYWKSPLQHKMEVIIFMYCVRTISTDMSENLWGTGEPHNGTRQNSVPVNITPDGTFGIIQIFLTQWREKGKTDPVFKPWFICIMNNDIITHLIHEEFDHLSLLELLKTQDKTSTQSEIYDDVCSRFHFYWLCTDSR